MEQYSSLVSVKELNVTLLDGTQILNDINFEIARGEVLGLVGESGSGKSTIATALLGYLRPGARFAGGSVTVDGRCILTLRAAHLQRLRGRVIGYVPQDAAMALDPLKRLSSVFNGILKTHFPHFGRAERLVAAEAALREVQLPGDADFLRRFPHQLSGGQQQRLLLALAFVLKPAFIILDEPTTALDVTTQARVLDLVRTLCRSHGVAALFVTHDLAMIGHIADRIAVLQRGRIVEINGRDSFFTGPSTAYSRKLLAATPRIDAPPAAGLPMDRKASPSISALLSARSIHASYSNRQVLEDVSVELNAGECLALVGESGSGKTTLARTLVGLGASNTRGILRFQDEMLPIRLEGRSTEVRRRVQYISQNPYRALNPRYTVGQALRRVAGHVFRESTRETSLRVQDALHRVQLSDHLLDHRPRELSGGERQRVAIARALICQPDVLICDEITSALDVSVQESILTVLRDLVKSGTTILFVTHDLGVVHSVADRIAVMQYGRIVEEGQTAEIFRRPLHPYTRGLLACSPHIGKCAPAPPLAVAAGFSDEVVER